MSDDPIQAAAGRLRRWRAGEDPWAVYGVADEDHPNALVRELADADRAVLADAYLAEHPADDAEPVTEEWLKSEVGMTVPSWHTYEPRLLREVVDDEGRWDMRLWWAIERRSFEIGGRTVPVATRGDVRRLFSALGVELK